MKKGEAIRAFRALGNARRFSIMEHLLANNELTVSQISERITLSFKSVSRHLLVLKNADLVKSRQVNLNNFYSINQEAVKSFIAFFKT